MVDAAAGASDSEVELAAVRAELASVHETLRAIRSGEIDALVIDGDVSSSRVMTLSEADRPYRMFLDTMTQGAATLTEHGVILYANQRLAEILNTSTARLVGSSFSTYLPQRFRETLAGQLRQPEAVGSIDIEMSGGTSIGCGCASGRRSCTSTVSGCCA